MQSFRERSGFHGNQHCYQQDPPQPESSRLEGYRHHHSSGSSDLSGRGYEAPHPLTATPGSKDCYGLQAYQGYAGDSTAPPKKQYKEGKVSVTAQQQHLQAGYANHSHGLGPSYPPQYLNEAHLQQKWAESSPHLPPNYDRDSAGTVGAGGAGGLQYMELNMLAVSQAQCTHSGQQPGPTLAYGGHHHHQQPQRQHPPRDASPAPSIHSQGRLHFPQQPQALPPSAQAYMEKCGPLAHCYKSYGVGVPPSIAQYGRQLGTSSSASTSSSGGGLKPTPYRSQNSYVYPQPPSRGGYEQLPAQPGMPPAQDSLPKYQHFAQPQQSYCLADISVRSPEQYYQNCSPSSGHSPARSMGRSPSYSSTPSPLMVGSETFQYSQQTPIVSGGPAPSSSSASSSSSAPGGLQDQALLMPSHSHSAQNVGHQTPSYTSASASASASKERFPEKLLSNPSLWSLNALTSQVESISNNVQQLLLSEALVGGRKASRRGGTKKGDDFKGQARMHDDAPGSDAQSRGSVLEAYGAPQPIPSGELQEAGYSSSSDEQLERNYYYCSSSQSRSPVAQQAPIGSQHTLDNVSSCSLTSPDDASTKSEDSTSGPQGGDGRGSVAGLQGSICGENLNFTPGVHTAQAGDNGNGGTQVKSTGVEGHSPAGGTIMPSPSRPQQGSQPDMQGLSASLKGNYVETTWSLMEGKEVAKERASVACDSMSKVSEGTSQQQHQGSWPEDEKCPALSNKVDKVLMGKGFPDDLEENIYRELQSHYFPSERELGEKASQSSSYGCDKEAQPAMKLETYKSELPTDYDALGKAAPFIWRNDSEQKGRCVSVKSEDPAQCPQYSSGVQRFEEKLQEDRKQEVLEECHPTPLGSTVEERQESGGLPSTENAADSPSQSHDTAEIRCPIEEQRDEAFTSTDAEGTELIIAERKPMVRDTTTPSCPTETFYPLQSEQAAPPSQARGHIDRRDAEVLEPDSPQLPGKSVLHPAPSWADTPPSPKKGDDDIEPGISCPSAVMPSPSAKSEPVAPSVDLGALHRKHARGRRGRPGRPPNMGNRVRGLPGTDDKGVPPGITSSKSTLLPDETGIDCKDISSQTPKLSPVDGFPSRMRTRSLAAQVVPKACAPLKRSPGPKPSGGCPASDPLTHPRGLISKIKWMKQRGLVQGSLGYMKGKRASGVGGQLDETHDSLPLPTPLPEKDQKSMVLRSRKQIEETPEKEKEKKRGPKMKEIKKQKAASLKEQDSAVQKSNLNTTLQKGAYKSTVSKVEEKVIPIMKKRKSSFQSSVPLKKQKGVKTSKLVTHESPAVTQGVRGPKRKQKRGEHLKVTSLTKDPPLSTSDVADHSGAPTQCPTKTKYLPPRKGRGLKYEAMVQKIASPGLKKQAQNPQAEDMVQGDLVPKTTSSNPMLNTNANTVLQDTEEKEKAKPTEVKTEEGEDSQNVVVGMESEIGTKATITGRRRGRPSETLDQPKPIIETAPEATSLIINTPRLAKQRAIKNNREMHMKQRRKRRKAPTTAEEATPSAPERPPDSTPPTASALPTVTTQPQPSLDGVPTSSTASVCKRGRPPRLPPGKRGRGKGVCKQSRKKAATTTLITGPKKKRNREITNNSTVETSKKIHKLKARHRKQCADHVTITAIEEKKEEEKRPDVPLKHKLQEPERDTESDKRSFRPYVRINSSDDLLPHCVIINRPEEDQLLHRARRLKKMRLTKAKNPSVITKAAMATSSAMLEGPLVNSSLSGRCLTCCLCGKPANYRGLGDLCGPYYPEGSIPRKALAFGPKLECREEGERAEQPGEALSTDKPLKSDAIPKGPGRRGRGGGPGRPRRGVRVERTPAEGTARRPSFREQYKRMRLRLLCGGQGAPAMEGVRGLEWARAGFRRLQLEAESKEHWAHEACAIWTNGVILIAGKLYGLTEAIHAAAHTQCSACQAVGASISCSREGCSQIFHFVCAKDTGCLLQEDNFSLKCTKHKDV